MINLICSSRLSICFSLVCAIFSAGVKYLQEPYIWSDGDCISTFWWRHIRGITGITILEVTFWLQYCLCFWHLSILSIWIRPPFVRKRKEQRTKQNKRRIVCFSCHYHSLCFDVVWFYSFQLLVSVLSQALTEKGLCVDFWDSVCIQSFLIYILCSKWTMT